MNEVLRIIKGRRSTRKFKSELIKESELTEIIEAGLSAPSRYNNQSWNFTVIQNQDLLDELNVQTKEYAKTIPNELIQNMAKNEHFNIFYNAPTVIIVSGQEDAEQPEIDCAAATENMIIAAESMEIGSCWTELVKLFLNSENGDTYKNKLNIPEGYKPLLGLVIGYKDAKLTKGPARKESLVQYYK